MQCRECGSYIEDNCNFCSHCGKQNTSANKPLKSGLPSINTLNKPVTLSARRYFELTNLQQKKSEEIERYVSKLNLLNLQITNKDHIISDYEKKLNHFRAFIRCFILAIIIIAYIFIPKYIDLKNKQDSLSIDYTKSQQRCEELEDKLSKLNASYQELKDDRDYYKNNESTQGSGLLQNILSSSYNNSRYTRSSSNSSTYYNVTTSNKNAVVEYYIGNKNSKIFHKNYCGSAAKMNDSNKIRFETEEEARNAGYRGCGNCSP